MRGHRLKDRTSLLAIELLGIDARGDVFHGLLIAEERPGPAGTASIRSGHWDAARAGRPRPASAPPQPSHPAGRRARHAQSSNTMSVPALRQRAWSGEWAKRRERCCSTREDPARARSAGSSAMENVGQRASSTRTQESVDDWTAMSTFPGSMFMVCERYVASEASLPIKTELSASRSVVNAAMDTRTGNWPWGCAIVDEIGRTPDQVAVGAVVDAGIVHKQSRAGRDGRRAPGNLVPEVTHGAFLVHGRGAQSLV